MSKQTELLKKISAKVRARGVKPFTKAFGKAMKAEFKKLKKSGRSNPAKSKKGGGKRRKSANKSTKATKKRTANKNPVAKNKGGGKKGKSTMTRFKKLLIGLGVGVTVSTIAAFARQPAIESAGPVIDALAGGGWEAQVGTAIPRLIRTFVQNGIGANGANGGGVGGA